MTVSQFEKENNLNPGSIRNPNGTCPRRNTPIETIKLRYQKHKKNGTNSSKLANRANEKSRKVGTV